MSQPSHRALAGDPLFVDRAARATEIDGLEAFDSEAAPTAKPVAASRRSPMSKDNMAIAALMLLVALQAYPSAVWVRNSLRRGDSPSTPSGSSAAAPAAAALVPASNPVPAAACEPAPAPSGPKVEGTAATAAAAGTAAAAAKPASPAGLAGMLAVNADIPLLMYVKGRLVGTSEADSTMLPQGTHDVEFVNESTGFRARRNVTIRPGATSTLKVDVPRGTIHVNAVPWAEVWIDGERAGETPIGNLAVRIGSHDVVFRHPDLGERRMSALVTLKEPARVSMDLRKK